MKVCLVHNEYGALSGEEVVVNATADLLRERGHTVVPLMRSSAEIPRMRLGKVRAFLSGIYNPASRRAMRKILADQRPDVVHVHNVFPLISPSILPECKKASVPVVMTVHNYRLVCPTGLHMIGGTVCEKCRHGKEFWCAIKNCTGSFAKSLGYSIRNYVARKRRFFLDNVDVFVVLSEFQRQRFIQDGIDAARIAVVPNMVGVDNDGMPGLNGEFVGYIGRVSPEKDVGSLMAAAAECENIPFKAAGSYQAMEHLPKQAPPNFEFLGHLDRKEVAAFYNSARMIVLPSVWFETFGIAIVDAMMHSKPVVCSRIGALPHIVDDGKTGLLFEPGNAEDMAEKIKYLWDRPDLCHQMGEAARRKAEREYSRDKYYERLMGVYHKAIGSEPLENVSKGRLDEEVLCG